MNLRDWIKSLDHSAEAENVRLVEEVEPDPQHGGDDRGDDRLAQQLGSLRSASFLASAWIFDPAHAQWQHGKQDGPPDHQVDHEAGGPAHGPSFSSPVIRGRIQEAEGSKDDLSTEEIILI